MRESRPYGSVRGARGNSRPYRVVRQPQSWCDPAGASPAQVKGSVLLGSECCVATGDSGCEAYTAIARGVGLSHERLDIAGAESFYSLEGNMCAPFFDECDVLSPCRGPRPHHCAAPAQVSSWHHPVISLCNWMSAAGQSIRA